MVEGNCMNFVPYGWSTVVVGNGTGEILPSKIKVRNEQQQMRHFQ
jgi:hypothetical protein